MKPSKSPPSLLFSRRPIDGLMNRIVTMEDFIALHVEYDSITKSYLDFPRANYVNVHRDVRSELERQSAAGMWANNASSRIRFARIALEEVEAHVSRGPMKSLYAVTLIPRQFVVRESEARCFNLRTLNGWIRQALKGYDYVGMIEAALYSNPGSEFAPGRAIAWHAHSLVLGASESQLLYDLERINGTTATLLPKMKATHLETISRDDVERKALYMLKMPIRDHRIFPRVRTKMNYETGEIIKVPTGTYKQKKQPLRTGDMVKFFNIFAGVQLPQLVFGGGDCAHVVRKIRSRAMAEARIIEHEADARLHPALRR